MGVVELPPSLKSIQIYLRLATEHQIRDPIIAYYCKLHALQEGMKINKNSKDCLLYLTDLMDDLEKIKKENKGNEAYTNDIVGQAYVEAYALKLFVFADTEDRNAHFNKNVVKAFFSASILFDVLTLFGPISEELEQQRKYAKWKATYINDCLKKGIEPHPGPPIDDPTFANMKLSTSNNQIHDINSHGNTSSFDYNTNNSSLNFKNMDNTNTINKQTNFNTQIDLASKDTFIQPSVNPIPPVIVPNQLPFSQPLPEYFHSNTVTPTIDPKELANAEKACKFASSALQYQDIPTAITYLQQSLAILLKHQNK